MGSSTCWLAEARQSGPRPDGLQPRPASEDRLGKEEKKKEKFNDAPLGSTSILLRGFFLLLEKLAKAS